MRIVFQFWSTIERSPLGFIFKESHGFYILQSMVSLISYRIAPIAYILGIGSEAVEDTSGEYLNPSQVLSKRQILRTGKHNPLPELKGGFPDHEND